MSSYEEGERHRHTGRMPNDDGDIDWSDESVSQGTPDCLATPETKRKAWNRFFPRD